MGALIEKVHFQVEPPEDHGKRLTVGAFIGGEWMG